MGIRGSRDEREVGKMEIERCMSMLCVLHTLCVCITANFPFTTSKDSKNR